MTLNATFAARLRSTRKTRGLTQMDLAAASNSHPGRISAYEAGHVMPGCASLVRLADTLGVTTDYLLGRQTLSQGLPKC